MTRVGPWCRDFSSGVTLRVILMIVLWIWYGLTPYTIPLESLWVVTAIMLVYSLYLLLQGHKVLGGSMILAAALNASLIPYASADLNMITTLAITAILIYDVIEAPQRACEPEAERF